MKIIRLCVKTFTVEYLEEDQKTWTKQESRAADFSHLPKAEVEALAATVKGMLPNEPQSKPKPIPPKPAATTLSYRGPLHIHRTLPPEPE